MQAIRFGKNENKEHFHTDRKFTKYIAIKYIVKTAYIIGYKSQS